MKHKHLWIYIGAKRPGDDNNVWQCQTCGAFGRNLAPAEYPTERIEVQGAERKGRR